MEGETRIPPPSWTPTNAEYHARKDLWSSSMLKVFRESPALAQGRFVTGRFHSPDATASLILGSAVNIMLLQPELERELLITAPAKTRGAKAYAETVAGHPEKLVLTESEIPVANAIADAVRRPRTPAARIAHELLLSGEGYSEYATTWDETVGGVTIPCKCMVDRVRMIAGRPVIIELKTTLDPEPEAFRRQAWNLEYHCQAAFNRRGMRRVLGVPAPTLLMVAIRNDEPYEVAVYEVMEEVFQLGTEQIESDLSRLAMAMITGEWWAEWEGLGEVGGVLRALTPPRWVMQRSQTFYD